MVEAIIAIVMALISYFGSKKAGASDGEAALIAAGVGAGSYYVATETDWGKGLVSDIKDWTGLTDAAGEPVLDENGNPIIAPPGAKLVLDAEGNPIPDNQGGFAWKVVDSTGSVLESWGAAGTAGVIGAGALAAGVLPSWVLPVGAGVALLVLLK